MLVLLRGSVIRRRFVLRRAFADSSHPSDICVSLLREFAEAYYDAGALSELQRGLVFLEIALQRYFETTAIMPVADQIRPHLGCILPDVVLQSCRAKLYSTVLQTRHDNRGANPPEYA